MQNNIASLIQFPSLQSFIQNFSLTQKDLLNLHTFLQSIYKNTPSLQTLSLYQPAIFQNIKENLLQYFWTPQQTFSYLYPQDPYILQAIQEAAKP